MTMKFEMKINVRPSNLIFRQLIHLRALSSKCGFKFHSTLSLNGIISFLIQISKEGIDKLIYLLFPNHTRLSECETSKTGDLLRAVYPTIVSSGG